MIRVKGNNNVKITLKYERLPHFCFMCGLMSHTEKDCSTVSDEEKEAGYGWGMSIRASPRKGLSKHREEETAIKARKNLFVPKPQSSGASRLIGEGNGNKKPMLQDTETTVDLVRISLVHGEGDDAVGINGDIHHNNVDVSDDVGRVGSGLELNNVGNGDNEYNNNVDALKDVGVGDLGCGAVNTCGTKLPTFNIGTHLFF